MSQQINLYNPLFLKKEKHFSAHTMLQALGIVALGIAMVAIYAFFQTRSTEKLAEQYRHQLKANREQLAKLGGQIASQAGSKAIDAEIGRLEAEVQVRQATLDALSTGELGNTGGFSEFLAAFGRQALPGVWLTRIQIADAGNDLAVQGGVLRPELMTTYLRALSKEPMMRGRRVTEMKLAAVNEKAENNRPQRFVEFSLSAPLQVGEPPTAKAAQ